MKKKPAREGKYTRLIQVWVTDEIDDAINVVVREQEIAVPKTSVVRGLLHSALVARGKIKVKRGATTR